MPVPVSICHAHPANQPTDPHTIRRQEPDRRLNPNGPRRKTVDEDEGEISRAETAITLAFAGPFSGHSGRRVSRTWKGEGSHYFSRRKGGHEHDGGIM